MDAKEELPERKEQGTMEETKEMTTDTKQKKLTIAAIILAVLCIIAVGLVIWQYTGDKSDKDTGKQSGAEGGTDKGGDTTPGGDAGEGTQSGDDKGDDTPSGGDTKPDDETPDNNNNQGNNTTLGGDGGNQGGNQGSHNSSINTGNLTEIGNGYEGTKGTGDFNYGEALQKAILFYELQRSGDLPELTRCNWRGDSGLTDGSDVGVDLTGGLYDAGDNVKFNLPMAYTSAVLAWTVYEKQDALEKSGQYEYIMDTIRWVNDYLIKCHPEDRVYYYQVGDGNKDHSWWGPAEVLQMERPSFCVTEDKPGSAVVGEAAASLAACAVVFAEEDPEYAALCLKHAKSLYAFAEDTKSDAGYTAANGFYNSWSGFYDELTWAGIWLYLATEDAAYLDKAETYWQQAGKDYKWTMCWDDVSTGATLMLARITEEEVYSEWMEKNLDYWTTGYNGERVKYTPKGLAYLDTWGALRYATTEAFAAALYSQWEGCNSAKADTYWEFAQSQINYALGSTGYSYVVGFGEEYPQHVHHRTAQGSYCDNQNEPSQARHTIYGALVGGPTSSDFYPDNVSDFATSEVACDYNAGFVGILAVMYEEFGGQTLKDFGAVETITEDEIYVDACVNVSGSDFVEIRAYVYNKSAWPARVADDVELRYYVDLTELYEAGGQASDIVVSTNYTQGGNASGLVCWDEEKHIYYVPINFSGTLIYPGGQSSYKKEVQFRIRNEGGVWNNENDPSYADLKGNNGSTLVKGNHMAIYEDGKLVFGTVPPSGTNAGESIIHQTPSGGGNQGGNSGNNQGGNQGGNNQSGNTGNQGPVNTTATSEHVTVTLNSGNASNANTLSVMLTVENASDGTLDLGKLEVLYYFTKDSDAGLVCECDYSCIVSGSDYLALSGVSGTFSAVKDGKTGADTVCTIAPGQSAEMAVGGTWTLQVRIHRDDWTEFVTGNDYSAKDVENIVVCYDGEVIFGQEP